MGLIRHGTVESRSHEGYPDHAKGYIYLGALLAERGRLAESEETHRHGTPCSEGRIDEACCNLGLVLRALERFEEAAACFRHAMDVDPQYEVARAALKDVERAVSLRVQSEQPLPAASHAVNGRSDTPPAPASCPS